VTAPSSTPSLQQVETSVRDALGVRVLAVRRQTRWRPTWFVDAERDGAPLELVVRGARTDTELFPLEHEVRFHRLLASHGIPVPAILGWLDDLGAVVLECVPGKPDFDGVDPAERDVVVDEYLQVLANVHALDVQEFVDAGIFHPGPDDDPAFIGHLRFERLWRAKKRLPHPFMEFCLGWLHRHPPTSNGRMTPIIWDTGQFHHVDGHLVAALDLEFGSVGDPMLDLALWRMRDTLIPFGDFTALYERYEELSGRPVDIEAIKRHHFAGTLENELLFGPAVIDPVDETDLMNNMQWNSETNLHATEALAESLGIELPEVETPPARRTRQDATYAHHVAALRALSLSEDDELRQHELRLAFRTARHLARVHEIGDAVEAADLDDLVPILGSRPDSWVEGDALLERYVLADAATGDHDEQLVRLFHRRNLRNHLLLGPAGSKMVAHFPTQPFAPAAGVGIG
jgi:aminoglycoside phosphotransferase (APT) family kinase protein